MGWVEVGRFGAGVTGAAGGAAGLAATAIRAFMTWVGFSVGTSAILKLAPSLIAVALWNLSGAGRMDALYLPDAADLAPKTTATVLCDLQLGATAPCISAISPGRSGRVSRRPSSRGWGAGGAARTNAGRRLLPSTRG